MHKRDEELSKGWGQFVPTFEMPIVGAIQKINCANVEELFRIIQSVLSKKADNLKLKVEKVL